MRDKRDYWYIIGRKPNGEDGLVGPYTAKYLAEIDADVSDLEDVDVVRSKTSSIDEATRRMRGRKFRTTGEFVERTSHSL